MSANIRRLLVIDDNESFRKLIARYLSGIAPGVEIDEYDPFIKGSPAVDFDWSTYDLIILDYFLGGPVTGLDLLKNLPKSAKSPAIVMLTAEGNEEVAVRAMKSGVHDYLRKENITKEKLRQSVLSAIAARDRERQDQQTATQSTRSFDKALFYQGLENALAATPGDRERALLLIELDDYEALGEEKGVVVQDNVVRHIAKRAFDIFADSRFETQLTRFSDSSVALLIVSPGNVVELVNQVRRLYEHLEQNPYQQNGETVRFTVSIGIVPLKDLGQPVRIAIRYARALCLMARRQRRNSYRLLRRNGDLQIKQSARLSSVQPSPATERGTNEFEASIADAEATHTARTQIEATRDTPRSPEPTTTSKPPAASVPASARPVVQATQAAKPARAAPPTPPPAQDAAGTPPPAAARVPTTLTDALHAKAMGASAEHVHAIAIDLEGADNAIVQAIAENRVLQYFQPMMPLSAAANQQAADYFTVRVRIVDTSGELIDARQALAELKNVNNQKILDRWMLRETIGKLVNAARHPGTKYFFIIKLSEESLADASLFKWLQQSLMRQEAAHRAGASIALEIGADTFLAKQRQAVALIGFLHKTYGFRFALSGITEPAQLRQCLEAARFDYVKLTHAQIRQIIEAPIPAGDGANSLEDVRRTGALIVATHIEDATTLTGMIQAGTDFAMGYLIGEPMSRVDAAGAIESFEIT